MDKLIAVFNDKGNFAGNIEVQEYVTEETIRSVLAPHRVEPSAHADAETYIVRPMRGMEVNEEGFFSLVKATLRSQGLIAEDASLSTGFGNFGLEVNFEASGDGYEAELVISRNDTQTTALALSLNFNTATRGTDEAACVAEDINSMIETGQAFNSLIGQGVEFLVEKLRERQSNVQATQDHSEPEQPVTPVKAQPLPQTKLSDRVERPRAPNAASPREVVDKVVAEARRGQETVKPTQVLGLLPIFPADRAEPIHVIIEMTNEDLESFVAEGVVTTLLQQLPEAYIGEGHLNFGASKGYLRTIRQALNDHGLEPISITPREPRSFEADEVSRFTSLI